MTIDYSNQLSKIDLRYIIVHKKNDLKIMLEEIFSNLLFTHYNISDISNTVELTIIFTKQHERRQVSLASIQIYDLPYHAVKEFEDIISDEKEIIEICKTYDSFKLEENREFLEEIFEIEMKIREIYTLLLRTQSINIQSSKVNVRKEYYDNEESLKKRFMNELFFIEFSEYGKVDTRKGANVKDLISALQQVKKIKDMNKLIPELLDDTLHLQERFNKSSRIPELIGLLVTFRNSVAHNRYLSENDVENFRIAKSIINEVYDEFISKLENNEI